MGGRWRFSFSPEREKRPSQPREKATTFAEAPGAFHSFRPLRHFFFIYIYMVRWNYLPQIVSYCTVYVFIFFKYEPRGSFKSTSHVSDETFFSAFTLSGSFLALGAILVVARGVCCACRYFRSDNEFDFALKNLALKEPADAKSQTTTWGTSRSRSSGWKPGDKAFDCITRPCFLRSLPLFRRRPLYRFIGRLLSDDLFSCKSSPVSIIDSFFWRFCRDVEYPRTRSGLIGYEWAALSVNRESLLGKLVWDLGWEVCAETRGLRKQTYPPSPVFPGDA